MISVFSATMEEEKEDWDGECQSNQTPLTDGKSSKLSIDLCEILSVKRHASLSVFSCWFIHACMSYHSIN